MVSHAYIPALRRQKNYSKLETSLIYRAKHTHGQIYTHTHRHTSMHTHTCKQVLTPLGERKEG